MQINILSENNVKQMIEEKLRQAEHRFNEELDRVRERLIELERAK